MKLAFRWYGENDPVSLRYISQIPSMQSIVTAVYSVPVGEVWPNDAILKLKAQVESHCLIMDVIESVPVHEDIKLGLKQRDRYIDAYCENVRRLGKAGVKCICYNFMPVFDWTRTELYKVAADGSTSLVYYNEQLEKMNPLGGELSLPGWDSSYKKEDLVRLFEQYKSVDKEKLFENLKYFLDAVIPVAEEHGVNMAIHPDDPPWDIFGLPRIINDENNIDRFLSLYDSKNNGLTFCTGSLGASKDNDLTRLVAKYAAMGRIHFMHIRNIKVTECGFEETAHDAKYGSLDIIGIIRALVEADYEGYIRPDHGRMIWGESGRPGYGLYDRALGASYINGVYSGLSSILKNGK